jgi:hypothetical protein
MIMKEVTERDLRMPEFRDAKLEDLEFRDDGKIVRKDRWETAIRKIAYLTQINTREGFEIDDVVNRVEALMGGHWTAIDDTEQEDWPEMSTYLDLRCKDGSILNKVRKNNDDTFIWNGLFTPLDKVQDWRVSDNKDMDHE